MEKLWGTCVLLAPAADQSGNRARRPSRHHLQATLESSQTTFKCSIEVDTRQGGRPKSAGRCAGCCDWQCSGRARVARYSWSRHCSTTVGRGRRRNDWLHYGGQGFSTDETPASVGFVGLAESDGDAGVDVKTDIGCLFTDEFGSLLDKPCISYTCMCAINQH